jgi:hypothetical protein
MSQPNLVNIGSASMIAPITDISEDVTSNEAASQEKLMIDLSHVSFLKPHIHNDEVYSLAHKGHTREEQQKTDVIKAIE